MAASAPETAHSHPALTVKPLKQRKEQEEEETNTPNKEKKEEEESRCIHVAVDDRKRSNVNTVNYRLIRRLPGFSISPVRR